MDRRPRAGFSTKTDLKKKITRRKRGDIGHDANTSQLHADLARLIPVLPSEASTSIKFVFVIFSLTAKCYRKEALAFQGDIEA
jgi:hypothetical protein